MSRRWSFKLTSISSYSTSTYRYVSVSSQVLPFPPLTICVGEPQLYLPYVTAAGQDVVLEAARLNGSQRRTWFIGDSGIDGASAFWSITVKLIGHSWYYACTLPHWPIIHRYPSYPSPHSCECKLVNSDPVRTNTRDFRMGLLPHFSHFMIFFPPHQLPHLSPFPYLLLLLQKANHPMNGTSWTRTSRDC